MALCPGLVPASRRTQISGLSCLPMALNSQRCELIFFEFSCLRQNMICTGTYTLDVAIKIIHQIVRVAWMRLDELRLGVDRELRRVLCDQRNHTGNGPRICEPQYFDRPLPFSIHHPGTRRQ